VMISSLVSKSIAVADVGNKATVGVVVLKKPPNLLAELVAAVTARLPEAKTFRRAALLWVPVMARVLVGVG